MADGAVQHAASQVVGAATDKIKSGTTIIVCMAATTGVVYVARLTGKKTDLINLPGEMLRIAVGGALVTVFLLIMTEFEPALAQGFAVLILFGALMLFGGAVGGTITTSFGPRTTAKGTPVPADVRGVVNTNGVVTFGSQRGMPVAPYAPKPSPSSVFHPWGGR